tara:strand:- start:239 stop:376 length:138 start_codon:yes stop_codon:yes gene_type:complete
MELRYLEKKIQNSGYAADFEYITVLQFRVFSDQWSPWQDVPTVVE